MNETTTLTVNIADYLTADDIKLVIEDEIRNQVRQLFKGESNAMRLLGNLACGIVFDEVDKVVTDSRQVIIDKVTSILAAEKNGFSFYIFRDKDAWSEASLGTKYITEAVRDSKALIDQKVKDTIANHDYSEEIWRKYEDLAGTFVENIYEIVRLGREKKAP